MTHNQIDYWKLQETKRSNLAQETHKRNELGETISHNRATEDELFRHQFATERENERHNVASEDENRRHNVASETLSSNQLIETSRHNVITEGEAVRSNVANEAIRRESNVINRYGAEIQASNVGLGYAQLAETQRRTDYQYDLDTAKLALEGYSAENKVLQESQRINLNERSLDEQIRHNKADEIIRAVMGGLNVLTDVSKVVLPFIK